MLDDKNINKLKLYEIKKMQGRFFDIHFNLSFHIQSYLKLLLCNPLFYFAYFSNNYIQTF